MKNQVKFPSREPSDWLFYWKITGIEYIFVYLLFAFQK